MPKPLSCTSVRLFLSQNRVGRHALDGRRGPGSLSSDRGLPPFADPFLAAFMLISLIVLMAAPAASAQQQAPGIIASGDIAVTGFSGTRPPDDGSGDLDRTFIDVDGSSLKVFTLGPPEKPRGQLLHPNVKFEASALDLGQVFGIALDDAPAPNIYVTATSVYGLPITIPDNNGDGLPERVKTGQPGASFMEGLFGTKLGGGPGSVWKIDGQSGEVSLFANIEHAGQANSGPGLGNIAYDPVHYQLYVSDLDTGMIQRLDMSGSNLGVYDHGTTGRTATGLDSVADNTANRTDITKASFDPENSDTWGLTDVRRRVWGLAYHEGRLYYGVEEGPQIWSVGIGDDGSFAADAQVEVDLVPGGFPVSDILFTSRGRMVIAQRGGILGSYEYRQYHTPKADRVLRYRKDQNGRWQPEPDEYAIGFPIDHKNASGGIGLACDDVLWSTGDDLRDNPGLAARLAMDGEAVVHGLQGNKLFLVRPRNVPRWGSYFIDYDEQYAAPEKGGHVGDVEVYRQCKGGRAETWPGWTPGWTPPSGWLPPPWWPRTPDLDIQKADSQCIEDPAVAGAYLCTFDILVTNVGAASFTGHLNVVDTVPANVEYIPPPGGTIPWNCAQPGGSGTPISCTSQNVETLLPGQSETLELTVRRTPLFVGDTLANCVIVDHPNDPPNGAWPGDPNGNNEDCGQAFPPGPDLEMRKTLNQCIALPLGTQCSFWLDVVNSGNAVYTGPLHVTDSLPPGAVYHGVAGQFPAGWMCFVSGAGQVDCRNPGPVTMWPNDMFWVEVRIFIPNGTTGDLQNCVRLAAPEHAGDPDINGNNADCDQAVMVSPISKGPPVNLLNAPVTFCPKGWTRFPTAKSVPKGWQQKKVGQGATALTCARFAPVTPPPPPAIQRQCPGSWQQFPTWNAIPKGWKRMKSGKGATAVICGEPRKTVKHCPRGMVGKWPNCRKVVRHCPRGTTGRWPNCRKIVKHCPRGTTGKWPNCRKIVKHCPRGMVGKWPNCRKVVKHCPRGTTGRWPNCRKIIKHCPRGTTGRWPNCRKIVKHCPRGTTGRWPNCKRVTDDEIGTTAPKSKKKLPMLKLPKLQLQTPKLQIIPSKPKHGIVY